MRVQREMLYFGLTGEDHDEFLQQLIWLATADGAFAEEDRGRERDFSLAQFYNESYEKLRQVDNCYRWGASDFLRRNENKFWVGEYTL